MILNAYNRYRLVYLHTQLANLLWLDLTAAADEVIFRWKKPVVPRIRILYRW